PERRQQFLKAVSRTARTEIVASKLLAKFLIPVNNADSAFHLRFGRETFATFAGDLKIGFILCVVCHTASVVGVCGLIIAPLDATKERWARDDAGIAIPLSYRGIWRPGLDSNQ